VEAFTHLHRSTFGHQNEAKGESIAGAKALIYGMMVLRIT
jgi:hypothetical protein